ncbi:hypothetical protein [Rhizobium sp. AC44/96]|nr:hypothetical protein [Rhizobium sp. AC44/96]
MKEENAEMNAIAANVFVFILFAIGRKFSVIGRNVPNGYKYEVWKRG